MTASSLVVFYYISRFGLGGYRRWRGLSVEKADRDEFEKTAYFMKYNDTNVHHGKMIAPIRVVSLVVLVALEERPVSRIVRDCSIAL